MGANASVRQARLKPEGGDRHPTLPASRWTTAAHMAEIVATDPPLSGGRNGERLLAEADFEFRGGARRARGSPTARTRSGERDSSPGSPIRPDQAQGETEAIRDRSYGTAPPRGPRTPTGTADR